MRALRYKIVEITAHDSPCMRCPVPCNCSYSNLPKYEMHILTLEFKVSGHFSRYHLKNTTENSEITHVKVND